MTQSPFSSLVPKLHPSDLVFAPARVGKSLVPHSVAAQEDLASILERVREQITPAKAVIDLHHRPKFWLPEREGEQPDAV